MDRWTFVLSGVGPHHSDRDVDVEKLASAFMASLQAAGHAELVGKLTMNASETIVTPAVPAPVAALAEPTSTKKKLPLDG